MTLIDLRSGHGPNTHLKEPGQAFDTIARSTCPAGCSRGKQTGDWDTAGQTRNPDLSDATTAHEEITGYNAGHSFAYELTGFTNALEHLIHGVRGEWTFTPDVGGTLIRWTYEFKPLHGRQILVGRVLAPLWRRYMQTSVDAAARVVEQDAPKAR